MPVNAQFKDIRYFTSSIVFPDGVRVPTIHTVCGVAEQTLPAGKIIVRKFVSSVAFSFRAPSIPNDSTMITWDLAEKEIANCRDLVVNRGL